MKRYSLFVLALLFSAAAFAQNVGIGTVAPSQKLDVLGNVKFSGALMPAGIAGVAGQFLQSSGPGLAPIWVAGGASGVTSVTADNGLSYTGVAVVNITLGGQLNTITDVDLNGWDLTFSGFGNVGIGTAAPAQKLHVGGNAQTIRVDGLVSATQYGGTGVLPVYATAAGDLTIIPPASAPSSDWSLAGNTLSGGEYIGTNNATDWVVKTNNAERMRVLSGGNVGIGTTSPLQALHVVGTVRISTLGGVANVGTPNAFATTDANGDLGRVTAAFPGGAGTLELWYRPTGAPWIQPVGNSNIRVYDAGGQPYGVYYDGNTNTIGGYFRTTQSASISCAVQGFSDISPNQTYGYLGYSNPAGETFGGQTLSGYSVYGSVNDPNRIAVFARTTLGATYAASIGYSNVWMAGYFYGRDTVVTYQARPALYAQQNHTISKGGRMDGIRGISLYNGGGNPGWVVGGEFISGMDGGAGSIIAGTEDAIGVFGLALGPGTGADPLGGYTSTINVTAGGYFQGNGNWCYIGYDGATNRKVIGFGNVSEIVPTSTHGRITMTCPESPEYFYTDYGTIQMINGMAHVELDPILVDIIVVDQDNPIRVFTTPVEMPYFNGVTMMNQTATGFDLVELNGGQHSGRLDYQLEVKPKTNFGEGRYVQAPGPIGLKGHEPLSSFAANQPDRSKIFHWPADWDVYGYDKNLVIPKQQDPSSDGSSRVDK